MGGPSGPGTTPAMSPGAGAGKQAAAIAKIKSVLPVLLAAINDFPVFDKRRGNLLQAVTRLESAFGKSENDDLTDAAAQQVMQGAKSPGGPRGAGMPPPGLMLGGPSPMNAMGGGQPPGGS